MTIDLTPAPPLGGPDLLTASVRARVGLARLVGLDRWWSWWQTFPTTAGPWPADVAGRALTRWQVSVARGPGGVLIFAGSDLYACGDTAAGVLLAEQVRAEHVDFGGLPRLGFEVLSRRR